MTNDPWDDDRLDAAYAARGEAHPTPTDLTASTIGFVRAATTHGRPSTTPRRLAIAAMVAVVIGGVGLAIVSFPQPSGPGAPTPSDAAGEATVSPPASASFSMAAPTQVAGLTVISVSDAIAIRDAGADGRELAVHGWFAAAPPMSCAAPSAPAVSPVQLNCADAFTWITERPEVLVTTEGNQTSGRQPTGPAVSPKFDPIDGSWMTPPAPGNVVPSPVEVVVVGHFDDRRSRQCPDAEAAACRDRFVVDRVCWADGREVPMSDMKLVDDRVSTIHEIGAILEVAAPGWPVLSTLTVAGGGLPEIEPVFRTRDEYGLTGEAAVWIVRVVASGEPVTYLVVDGTDRTYRMTPDGRVDFLGDVAGSESWPPAGATIVNVPGVEIAVVDLSNHLLGARAASLDSTTLPPDIAAKPIHLAETTTPGELLLTWSGSGCDRRASVTVGRSLTTISVERIEAPECDGDARSYGLILTFDDPVDVDSIELSTTRRVSITP